MQGSWILLLNLLLLKSYFIYLYDFDYFWKCSMATPSFIFGNQIWQCLWEQVVLKVNPRPPTCKTWDFCIFLKKCSLKKQSNNLLLLRRMRKFYQTAISNAVFYFEVNFLFQIPLPLVFWILIWMHLDDFMLTSGFEIFFNLFDAYSVFL